MRRRSSGFADLLSSRIPIIRLGQSNIASRYQDAAGNCGVVQMGEQDAIHVYHTYSHNMAGAAQTSERATWERIKPHPVGTPESGNAKYHWGLDLATGLSALGLHVAILDWCIGGTSLDYWAPSEAASQYDTFIVWIQARLAELTTPQQPVVLFDQGESGNGTCSSWAAGMADLMSALRTDLGYPTMGVVLQQVPENGSSYSAEIAASKDTYAAGDVHSRIANITTQTFVTDIPNLHIDAVGGRKLALGPDAAGVVSYLTGIKSLLGIAP
jgi:hypothetical protein